MKNLASSYSFKPHGHLVEAGNYLFELDDDGPSSALTQGLYHQVENWIALELTAEQMLGNEVNIVTTYVAGDAQQMWDAIKDGLMPYEIAAGNILLRAADPTQVEWLHGHWWDSHDNVQN